MDDIGVHHITRLPHYHQSNGPAENYVQIVQSLLYRPKSHVKTYTLAYSSYRNTAFAHDLPSAMELLFARQARCDLPMSHAAILQVKQAATKQPATRPQSEIIRQTNKNQAQATTNPLPIGTYVMYKTPQSKLYYPDISSNILYNSQSYIIKITHGTTCRCLRFYLKPYKLPTSQGTQVSAQFPVTNCIQWHTKQVSAQKDQCLKQFHRSIRNPVKMDLCV